MLQMQQYPEHTGTLILIGSMLVGGLITLHMKVRIYAIVSSVLGSFALLQGLATSDWFPFFNDLPSASQLLSIEQGGTKHDGGTEAPSAAQTMFWVEIGLFLGIAFLGAWVQLRQEVEADHFFDSPGSRGRHRVRGRGEHEWGRYRELHDDGEYA